MLLLWFMPVTPYVSAAQCVITDTTRVDTTCPLPKLLVVWNCHILDARRWKEMTNLLFPTQEYNIGNFTCSGSTGIISSAIYTVRAIPCIDLYPHALSISTKFSQEDILPNPHCSHWKLELYT